MALPDTFERIGIVIGCVFLNAIAVSGLTAVVFGADPPVLLGLLILMGPGAVLGWLIATGRLEVPYSRVWWFAIVTMLVSIGLYALTGLTSTPGPHPAEGTVLWLVAAAIGALVADYDSLVARLR
ncbi:hypothetical protein U3A55_11585 [Salarchaeum sp. III]|uniref:hypothetical protein n=1 Tax=Salarchaeum sp. III TaxID=3107927 RepID=UPI002ED79F0E